MKNFSLVVAALLLTSLANAAVAAEDTGQKSKYAQKILQTLNALGINDKDVQNFVEEADTHVSHGYYYLNETNTMGGKLSIRYALGKLPSTRQVELHFAPDDSHLAITARPNIAMISYHLEFK